MIKKFSLPRGTADILPQEIKLWQEIERKAREELNRWNYHEIRTPLFEETELFARSMGQTSDIVQKQMLNIAAQGAQDSGPQQFSLRPEGTAAIVRSYIQNDMDKKEGLSKLYYLGPMFRGERPQKGRLRQFHQIGIEAIGSGTAVPLLDAELIALGVSLLDSFGLPRDHFILKLNTLGTDEDKQNFSQFLRDKISSQIEHLCQDCQNRFSRNIFRVLDCKNRQCQGIIQNLELDHSYLLPESRQYFADVGLALSRLGIKYQVQPSLVRGLDYYTHTVFEFSCPLLGSQDALGAGGRYGGLVEQLGGPQVDAIGLALGVERILLALGQDTGDGQGVDAFLVSIDELSLKENFIFAQEMRRWGLSVDLNLKLSSVKSQMRLADKLKARYVIILGEEEMKQGMRTVKDMQTGEQQSVALKDLRNWIQKSRP